MTSYRRRPDRPKIRIPGHIPNQVRGAFARAYYRYNPPPPHCPYRLGDAVQFHGYPAYKGEGYRETGFRGWVVGCVGATILTGVTTTGDEWWEYWGSLKPDGLPVELGDHCVCCHDERLRLLRELRAKETAAGVQLDLLGGAS